MASLEIQRAVRSFQRSLRSCLNKRQRRARLRYLLVFVLTVYYLSVLRHWYVKGPVEITNVRPPCGDTWDLEDVFVAVRTGATEIRRKLPVVLENNLRCVPSYAIFSDKKEELFGHQVHDALSDVSEGVKSAYPEFELYKKLQSTKIQNIKPSDVYRRTDEDNNGHAENLAWVLDKWKFLPLAEKSYTMRPDAKWYVIIEPDAYVVWPNLVRLLAQFNHTNAHYIGSTMAIGDILFAHGGGGIIISNEAMKRFVRYYGTHRKELEEYTAKEWAGDYVLGKAMFDAQVNLQGSWPLQQIHSFSGIDYARADSETKRIWCAPALSYHHLNPAESEAMTDLEEWWNAATGSSVLRHKDVFEFLVLPQITLQKMQWDGFAGEDMTTQELANMTIEKCFMACREKDDCKQYSLENGVCRMSSLFHLGQEVPDAAKREIVSGWMRDRILHHFHHLIPSCPDDKKDEFTI